jgi:ATP-dependent helicase/nuclease subunit B
MSDAAAAHAQRPTVFTIPTHRSFADSLAAGLIARFGADPLGLAAGRILLPNNRAVRTVTEAFVRASGAGLLLPRLFPIGDAEIDERIGGALEPLDDREAVPPAIEPLRRLLDLAKLVRRPGESTAEALRLAREVARTMDAMTIEEVGLAELAEAASDAPELAAHWQSALARLEAVLREWPEVLKARGLIELTERRNRLLRGLAQRPQWPTCWPELRECRKDLWCFPASAWLGPCPTRNGKRSVRTQAGAGRRAIPSSISSSFLNAWG